MKTIRTNISSALEILDAQIQRIGNDLEAGSDNLKALVANRDQASQEQISQISGNLTELNRRLTDVRKLLVSANASAWSASDDESASSAESGRSGSETEPNISAVEASKIRHDEPVTLSGIFRSLLMANEPAQRERRGALE